MLTTSDADSEFIEWITNLEKRTVELLYEKRHLWFTQELDQTDIENSLASPLRAYKNSNYLLRVNLEPNRLVSTNIQPFLCKVFDEHKKPASVEYIKADHSIISIVEFQGIKFTSRNFQIELLLRQVLVLLDVPLFETCLIRDDTPQRTTPVPLINAATASKQQQQQGQPNDLGLVVPADKCMEQIAKTVVPDNRTSGSEVMEACDEPEPEPEPEFDESEKYISSQPLKHFEYTEVDIDFKDIPDVIDVNEPTFKDDTTTTIPPKISKPITLKKHKDVLYEMYKIAKQKANEMKRAAMRAYLEAKEIKAKYLLDDLDDLDTESSDDDSKN